MRSGSGSDRAAADRAGGRLIEPVAKTDQVEQMAAGEDLGFSQLLAANSARVAREASEELRRSVGQLLIDR